jgi:trimeric autotransporter adhesin
MATITGTTALDWSTISLAQVGLEGDLAPAISRLDELFVLLDNPDLNATNVSQTSTTFSATIIPAQGGGRVTASGVNFNTDAFRVTNFQYSNTATGELLRFTGAVGGFVGPEFFTSLTIGSTGITQTFNGNIAIETTFAAPGIVGNYTGSVTSMVARFGATTMTITGTFALTGDLTGASMTGIVSGITLLSGTSTMTMTGLSIDWATLTLPPSPTIGDLIAAVGGLPSNDIITYTNNSSVGMMFNGGAGSDSIVISGLRNDTINGGDDGDFLSGGLGADIVDGGLGDDSIWMEASLGNSDTIDAGGGLDTLRLQGIAPGNQGVVIDLSSLTDQVVSIGGVGDTRTQTNFEHLEAAGLGGFVTVTGSAEDNTIYGSKGNDNIDGGAGNDQMTGRQGNDTYVVDSAGDFVGEITAEGTDKVFSSITYTVGPYVEHLELTGSTDINGTGNALANILTGNNGINVLTGLAGNDTYVVQNDTDSIVEALNGGIDLVLSTAATFTLGANVENLTLAGTDDYWGEGNGLANMLTGNSGDNQLSGGLLNDKLIGNAGNDRLDGGAGVDNMVGGLGNDTYVRDVATDVITEALNAGTDTVESSLNYTLGANLENLTLTDTALTGTGNTVSNTLVGNSGNNTLSGLAGNDLLNGSGGDDTLIGGLGADTMIGELGDDLFILDTVADTVIEVVGEGSDTVRIAYNVTGPTTIDLTAVSNGHIENVQVIGTGLFNLTGNVANNILTGNAVANTLIDNDGDDILDGGLGADTMIGGTGDDTYTIDNLQDVVTEQAGDGNDTVRINRNVNLNDVAFANIEYAVLTGTAALNATGSDDDNILTGNSAANVLDGGLGSDEMVGGAGNDTYVVNSAFDDVTETLAGAAGGVDLVRSGVDFTLGAHVENLTLTGSALNATGNSLNNILTGNSGDNTLTGDAGNDRLIGNDGNDTLNGGAGVDNMVGGLGNDTYVRDMATDVITEALNAGTDTVQSSLNYILGANLENLTLTGNANLTGTGNTLANILTGNDGINILSGLAGNDSLAGLAGNDTLNGGLGNDVLNGGVGDDLILLGTTVEFAVGETIDGGADTDTLRYTGAAAATLTLTNLVTNIEQVQIASAAGLTTGVAAINVNAAAITNGLTMTGNNGANILTGTGQADSLVGNAGNDILNGGAGTDTLNGGLGLDTLQGGLGNDTYQVNRGNGQDTIVENDATVGNSDTLLYGATITAQNLVLSQQANHLRIALSGSTDSVTIQNWFVNADSQIETIQAGGQDLLNTEVNALIQVMATFTTNTGLTWTAAAAGGGTVQQQADFQAIIAANWQ